MPRQSDHERLLLLLHDPIHAHCGRTALPAVASFGGPDDYDHDVGRKLTSSQEVPKVNALVHQNRADRFSVQLSPRRREQRCVVIRGQTSSSFLGLLYVWQRAWERRASTRYTHTLFSFRRELYCVLCLFIIFFLPNILYLFDSLCPIIVLIYTRLHTKQNNNSLYILEYFILD